MSKNLKHLVQQMIDDGSTEEEIALEIKKHSANYLTKKDNLALSKNKTFEKILKSKSFSYLIELILPIILSVLFNSYFEIKHYNSDIDIDNDELITFSFSFLFFLALILEWLRRKRDKENRPKYFKYLYIPIMLLTFIFGIWYINELIHN